MNVGSTETFWISLLHPTTEESLLDPPNVYIFRRGGSPDWRTCRFVLGFLIEDFLWFEQRERESLSVRRGCLLSLLWSSSQHRASPLSRLKKVFFFFFQKDPCMIWQLQKGLLLLVFTKASLDSWSDKRCRNISSCKPVWAVSLALQ